MIIPSKEMVTEYSKSVAPLYSRIANNLDEIQTLIQIRDTLLPKLMDGEIEVEAHAF
jgi:type I restriction enzyme S subunit